MAIASNRIPGTTVNLKRFGSKSETLDRALSLLLHGEVSASTRALLGRKLAEPLPAVSAGDELDDAEVPEMRPQGAPGARGRTAPLLPPSGDPDVFKAVSLVLGTPAVVRDRLLALRESFQADELMAITITGDYGSRLESYELLADVFRPG